MRKKPDLTDARKQILKKHRQNERARCEQVVVVEQVLNDNQNNVSDANNPDETSIEPIAVDVVEGCELNDTADNKPMQRRKKKGADVLEKKRKRNMITPSWLQIHRPLEGHALRKSAFIPYKPNVSYEYWDDPNELCERLQMLVSSQNAGNTNHSQEIDSIVEELSERGIIS